MPNYFEDTFSRQYADTFSTSRRRSSRKRTWIPDWDWGSLQKCEETVWIRSTHFGMYIIISQRIRVFLLFSLKNWRPRQILGIQNVLQRLLYELNWIDSKTTTTTYAIFTAYDLEWTNKSCNRLLPVSGSLNPWIKWGLHLLGSSCSFSSTSATTMYVYQFLPPPPHTPPEDLLIYNIYNKKCT